MLNGEDGSVIRTDGRTIVAEDKDGGGFPWFPKPVEGILRDGELVSAQGSTTFDNSVKSKIFGLYFSAHWVSLNVCIAWCVCVCACVRVFDLIYNQTSTVR